MARTKVVSWLRAIDSPSQLFLQPVAYESALTARYSGGAAPAFNRFPWLPSAIDCWAKLSTSQRLRKREHHRPPDHQRNRDQIAWIDGVRRRGRRKVDYCD